LLMAQGFTMYIKTAMRGWRIAKLENITQAPLKSIVKDRDPGNGKAARGPTHIKGRKKSTANGLGLNKKHRKKVSGYMMWGRRRFTS